MSNMSYCRFQNTLGDYEECLGVLQRGEFPRVSKDEQRAAENLYKASKEYIEAYEDYLEEDAE